MREITRRAHSSLPDPRQWVFGRGWKSASLCHSNGHRDIETRPFGCRPGRCSQYLPRIFGADQLGAGRGLLRLAVGSKAKQGGGPGRIGTLSKVAELGDSAQPFQNGVIPKLGAISVSTPGALDAWVDAAPAPWRLRWPEVLEPAIHLCEAGVPVPQIITHRRVNGSMSAFLRQPIAKSSENVGTREPGSPSENLSGRVCQSVRSRLTMKA